MRYDFSQLIDMFLLQPEMSVTEKFRCGGRLAPT